MKSAVALALSLLVAGGAGYYVLTADSDEAAEEREPRAKRKRGPKARAERGDEDRERRSSSDGDDELERRVAQLEKRVRQLEGQVPDECIDPFLATRECNRFFGLREGPQVSQAQVMREQLLERESLLAGVTPFEQFIDCGLDGGFGIG